MFYSENPVLVMASNANPHPNSVMSSFAMDRIREMKVTRIRKLSPEDTQIAVESLRGKLVEIFSGASSCERHTQFKSGAAERRALLTLSGPFSDEQFGVVGQTLTTQ